MLRKYGKTAAMAASAFVGDSPLFLFDYLMRFLRVALLLSLWRTLYHGRTVVGGLTLPAILTYSLIAEVFAEPLAGKSGVDSAFWSGDIATRFLRPMGTYGQFVAEAVGCWAFGFALFSLPLLLIAPLLGANPLPAGPQAALAFSASLLLAISVGLALDFLFVGLAIGFQLPFYAVSRVRNAIGSVLSGALLPLSLLPWGIGNVVGWLPFASMASAPLRIYAGDPAILRLLAIQAFWAATLWPLVRYVWRANRERMVSYGG